MKPIVKIFKDPEAVARAYAEMLQNMVAEKNCHIALSGGSTPNLLFEILGTEYSFNVKWQNVHLYWGDERCVPPFSSESNFKNAKARLIDHVAIPTQNVHRIRGEGDPAQEAKRYSQRINTLVPSEKGLPKFDLITLGLGSDGHTASIFPHEMHLLNAPNICEIATHPESGQKRVTLTGDILNHTSKAVFLVTGDSKAEKVREILSNSSSKDKYPASHIICPTGEVHWYLDEAAAAELE